MSTGIKTDWWYGNRELSERELAGVYRRMKRRGDAPTEEHAIERPTIRLAPAPLGIVAKSTTTMMRCVHCEEEFVARTKGRRYCSEPCRRAYNRRMSDAGRHVAEAKRRMAS